jgi:hypothetical protein
VRTALGAASLLLLFALGAGYGSLAAAGVASERTWCQPDGGGGMCCPADWVFVTDGGGVTCL